LALGGFRYHHSAGEKGGVAVTALATRFINNVIVPSSLLSLSSTSLLGQQHENLDNDVQQQRRTFLTMTVAAATATIVPVSSSVFAAPSTEESSSSSSNVIKTKSTADAIITDKIYIEFKGLSSTADSSSATATTTTTDRIVIGLFGKDAPQPVSILKALVTSTGYPAKCKPLDSDEYNSRLLEKERLEKRKVYNSCIQSQDIQGVNYYYSTVWRVIPYERIDVGATVSGKFIARENPIFIDNDNDDSTTSRLTHDSPGVVSVRRGNGGGYGFTIFPGSITNDNNDDTLPSSSVATLNEENIVIGRIIEGMDVIQKLNNVPTVHNTFSGGQSSSSSSVLKGMPSRGCRYGGSEYFCAENKPLRKIVLDKMGVL
jgi:cyclophilin family peptidyl-prolyl cis-trans isomerase